MVAKCNFSEVSRGVGFTQRNYENKVLQSKSLLLSILCVRCVKLAQ